MFRTNLLLNFITFHKCHAYHVICTLSPCRAALTLPFAENTQHDTSEVLRLPRKIKIDMSKVPILPRKMRIIFGDKALRVPHNTSFDLFSNRSTCHEVPRLPRLSRETRLRDGGNFLKKPLHKTYLMYGHMAFTRMVANGSERLRTCNQKRNIERTHLHLPPPKSEKGNPCYAVGKKQLQPPVGPSLDLRGQV